MVDAIKDQAARWVARVDGGLTPVEEEQLEAWLREDVRHRGAYAWMLAYWMRLDRCAALAGTQAAATNDGTSLSRRQWMAAAAAAATLGGSATWWLLRPTNNFAPEPLGQPYSTDIGQIRRVALTDGSVVVLNTASSVLVRLEKALRTVQLLSGEALFEVAHDKSRPFVVAVKNAAIRAIGTAFAVRLGSTQVDVTVTEGVVELAHSKAMFRQGTGASSSAGLLARVSAFQHAVITGTSEPQVRSITPDDANRVLAWRQGLVSFYGESLQVAVSEINRYNRRQIIVDDLALAAKPVVGVFGITDLDGFAAAAAAALGAKAVIIGDVIRLKSGSAAHN